MVGVDTVIADDPQLTVRHVKGKNPLRIIVDSRLRTPECAAVLSCTPTRSSLIATAETDPLIHRRFQTCGAEIMVCRELDDQVDMGHLLEQLGRRGVQSVLLEGGSRLAGNALKRGLIDDCIFFYSPKVIGSDGLSPFGVTGIAGMADAIRFTDVQVRRMGNDIVITARPEKTCLPD